jgi:DeoR/GlpR family transcriptional regulator of sugar metabolism
MTKSKPIAATRLKLSKNARHQRIVQALQDGPTLRVLELAAGLGVSTETIRRDLDELSRGGFINRTYGGAVRPFGPEPTLHERHQLLVAEREAIAQVAIEPIKDGEIVLLGGGATTTHVARRLAAARRSLKVITDSLAVASALASNAGLEVMLCPGRFHGSEQCVYGGQTIDYLGRLFANHAVLGATGLTVDGPNDAEIEVAATYRAMAARASAVTVVADHSKFDRAAISVYASWSDVSRLVTDRQPNGPLRAALERAGVQVALV